MIIKFERNHKTFFNKNSRIPRKNLNRQNKNLLKIGAKKILKT